MKRLLLLALVIAACSTPKQQLDAGAEHKLGSTFVPQQAGDFWVNPSATTPFAIKDTGGVTRDTFETAHGRIQIGKGGSDFYAVVGPTSGAETTDTSLYFGANGDTQNNSTFAVGYGAACQNLATHAGSVCFNGRGSGAVYGDILFTNANGNAGALEMLGRFDGVSGVFFPVFGLSTGSAGAAVSISASTTTPTIQSGANATSLTIGPNKTGATLVLASSTFQTSATFDWNGNTATIPLVLNYGVSNGTSTATGGMAFTTITITGNRTLDTTTKDNIVYVDTSGGVVSVTLPAPVNGRSFTIVDKKNTFGTNACTIVRNSTEKIDNVAASKVLNASGYRANIISDGTDWYTMNVSGSKPATLSGALLALVLLLARRRRADNVLEHLKEAA